MPYISGITVVYGDNISQKPVDTVKEYSNQDPDINKGFKGKFVWLIANWTDNPSYAISGFDVVVSDNEIPGMQDLGKGAGGKFRYLRPSQNGRIAVDMRLFRSRDEQKRGPLPWTYMTTDINTGRHGEFLYVLLQYE